MFRLLLVSNKQTTSFPKDKWRLDKTDLHCCCSVKSHIFVNRQIHDTFMGCPLMRKHLIREKLNFRFQKCLHPFTRECLLTGMCKYKVWVGDKKGIWKIISRTVTAYKSVHWYRLDCNFSLNKPECKICKLGSYKQFVFRDF